uniref:Uncharacterized protein n=1 Tax=Globisporangium ultimum (strain ATCC 200006 / CBS 805.95 / DAOM BR144) TaxID=431595 RepID=K3XAE2_GLOUD
MGLHRTLNPELVLCSSCRGEDDNESRWSAYADETDGFVLVRDVCAARSCPELQVRGHFCVNHVLQYELSWQRFFPLRTCSFCRKDVLQLYSAKEDVWFICPANDITIHAHGAEKKLTQLTPKSVAQTRSEQKKKRRARTTRRLARKPQSNKLKERLLALDWSLGNIRITKQFLWKENKRRLEAESNPQTSNEGGSAANSAEKERAPFQYPDPTSVFCVVSGCKHFAKTGDHCRFHSPRSMFPPHMTHASGINTTTTTASAIP